MRIIETFLRGQQPKNLPTLKERLGPNRLVAVGTVGTAITMAMYGLARSPATALAAAHLSLLAPKIDDFRGSRRQKAESDQWGSECNACRLRLKGYSEFSAAKR